MKKTFTLTLLAIIVGCSSSYAQIEGNYHSVGYFTHPTSPRAILLDKALTKVTDSTYTTTIGDLTSANGTLCLNIHKNKTVTFENSFSGSYAITATTDSINKYDPLLRQFNIHYQYTIGSGTRIIRELLTQIIIFKTNKITYKALNLTDVALTKGDSCTGQLTIPETVLYNGTTYKVTTIADNAFTNDTLLTGVTLPQSVTSIGVYSFGNCKHLTSINIPNTMTSIGDWAFQLTGLTSISIPASVTNLGANPFECGKLASIDVAPGNANFKVIDGVLFNSIGTRLISCIQTKTGVYEVPNSVTVIGNESFGDCSLLTSIIIPTSVTTIEDGAFQVCKGLTTTIVPSSVTSFGTYVFWQCESLVNTSLPNTITEIGFQTYGFCKSLTSFIIPTSITSIGSSAFTGCVGLTSIEIPSSVTIIENNPWSNCKLSTILVNAGNTTFKSINNVLYLIDGTQLILCAQTKSGAFEIPGSVTQLAVESFSGCSQLTSLSIPASVTLIGGYALQGCSKLTWIKTFATTPPAITPGYTYITSGSAALSIPVYVPTGTLSSYQAATGWSMFTNMSESSDVAGINSDNIQYSVKDGVLLLSGLTQTNLVSIFDMNGKYICQSIVNAGIAKCSLPGNGIFIAKVGDKSIKIMNLK